VVNIDQTRPGCGENVERAGATGAAMTSIVPFISNAVFEPADIRLMSDAYSRALEDVYGFGHPNKVVEKLIAAGIMTLTRGGERDPERLCERALAVCGFKPAKRGPEGT
jgi:hypothetical protein